MRAKAAIKQVRKEEKKNKNYEKKLLFYIFYWREFNVIFTAHHCCRVNNPWSVLKVHFTYYLNFMLIWKLYMIKVNFFSSYIRVESCYQVHRDVKIAAILFFVGI